jgi:hypothetical protein
MKFHNFGILITIIFLIFKIKGNYTTTLEEQIIQNKLSTTNLTKIIFNYNSILKYNFTKIKIHSKEHQKVDVYLNYNTLILSSFHPNSSSAVIRIRDYNPYFYIDSKNVIFLGILSPFSDYNVTYQGIFSNQIELYDNTNFTLNTSVDHYLTINYTSQLENLNNNYIVVSITFTSLNNNLITAKYKGKNIKVYQIFPYSHIIILSSSIIPNYIKGEILYISFISPQYNEIKISSRIINLNKKKINEGLSELKPLYHYFSILGDKFNITKECFYLNESLYNINTTFAI